MKTRKGEKFVILYNAMLWDREIGSTEVLVYLYLCSLYNEREGGAFPTEETIGRDMGLSTRQVGKIIKRLESLSHIKIVKRTHNAKGEPFKHKRNLYQIPHPREKYGEDLKKSWKDFRGADEKKATGSYANKNSAPSRNKDSVTNENFISSGYPKKSAEELDLGKGDSKKGESRLVTHGLGVINQGVWDLECELIARVHNLLLKHFSLNAQQDFVMSEHAAARWKEFLVKSSRIKFYLENYSTIEKALLIVADTLRRWNDLFLDFYPKIGTHPGPGLFASAWFDQLVGSSNDGFDEELKEVIISVISDDQICKRLAEDYVVKVGFEDLDFLDRCVDNASSNFNWNGKENEMKGGGTSL